MPRTFDEERVLEVVMEAGAEDLTDDGDHWSVTSAPAELAGVHTALEEAGLDPGGLRADHGARPPPSRSTTESEAKRVLRLIEALDDHDDVQNVYANFDIPDAVMAAYEG